MWNEWSDIPAPVRRVTLILAVVVGPVVFGCMSVPRSSSIPADLSVAGLTDAERQRILRYRGAAPGDPAPSLRFPAVIAVAEVTGGYEYGHSGEARQPAAAFQVVTHDTFAKEKHLDALRRLPEVLAVRPLDHRIYGARALTASELRQAAHAQRADLLLLYTFDGVSQAETHLGGVALVTLGLLPTSTADAEATCHALLIDTRTGYLYGMAAARDDATQLANVWTEHEAADDTLRRAQRRAFEKLVDAFPRAWDEVRLRYR